MRDAGAAATYEGASRAQVSHLTTARLGTERGLELVGGNNTNGFAERHAVLHFLQRQLIDSAGLHDDIDDGYLAVGDE